MNRVLRISVAAVVAGALALGPAEAKRADSTVHVDTMPGGVVNHCGARTADYGGPVTAVAAHFSVAKKSKLPTVTLPLAASTVPSTVQIKIVGNSVVVPESTQFWENEPNEDEILGVTTAAVATLASPCGPAEFITVDFPASPMRLQPEQIYWVVIRQPSDNGDDGISWFNATSSSSAYGFAQFVPPGETGPGVNPGWIAYVPGTYPPSALRATG